MVTVPCGLGARPEKRITTNRSAIWLQEKRNTRAEPITPAAIAKRSSASAFPGRSMIGVLVWMYYSCLILLFGAELTQGVADRVLGDR